MTDTLKSLAQVNPSATTLTDAYTAVTQVVVSSIFVTNRSSTPTSFRISVAVAGGADNSKQYLYYDTPISGNDTIAVMAGITLASTDKVRVFATLATLSFNIFGDEVS